MRFTQDTNNFLDGRNFSSSLSVPFLEPEKMILYRMEYIEELVRGKNVIHFGCVDHIPIIEEKIRSNTWLHKRLLERTKQCVGIDNSIEGIDFIKRLGFQDVYAVDAIKDKIPKRILKEQWDYMIMGEIVEHLDNPVEFLGAIKKKFKSVLKKIVITVPNALRWQNFWYGAKNIEFINSDHRFWFTPYTLAKVATRAGLQVDSFSFAMGHTFSTKNFLKTGFLRKFPAMRDTLVMIASL